MSALGPAPGRRHLTIMMPCGTEHPAPDEVGTPVIAVPGPDGEEIAESGDCIFPTAGTPVEADVIPADTAVDDALPDDEKLEPGALRQRLTFPLRQAHG